MATSPETAHARPTPTVGTSVPRVDGAAKVTGEARYVDDLPRMPGELFGATVRSPVARGILKGIHLDPAFDWAGVTVVNASDLAVNTVALIVDDQPILAASKINHAYEPVALLACESEDALQKLALAVRLKGMHLSVWLEPDLGNRMTAIAAFEPASRIFARLPLALA